MYKPLQIIGVVTFLSAAAFAAIAYDAPPDSIARPGDPERWYKPADTPGKVYANAVKEANAALNEAIKGCREEAKPERRACVQEALRTYHQDVRAAKNVRDGREGWASR
ncbi:MAG TPA: hypothetical protein VMG61_05110 [Usitatibacter sp.]|nr:hypothetical protein [Usitatibacter sp.]